MRKNKQELFIKELFIEDLGKVTGGKGPIATTLAVGEEDPDPTTLSLAEEDPTPTTLSLAEEG